MFPNKAIAEWNFLSNSRLHSVDLILGFPVEVDSNVSRTMYADKSAMTQVARIGGGRFFHADNGAELERVFREIALTLSTILTQ